MNITVAVFLLVILLALDDLLSHVASRADRGLVLFITPAQIKDLVFQETR